MIPARAETSESRWLVILKNDRHTDSIEKDHIGGTRENELFPTQN
jgi:hypothetical protein